MASITDIRAIRMKGLRSIRKSQRTLDSKVELLERFLMRALKWKDKVPEIKDLERISAFSLEIDRAFQALITTIGNQFNAWKF